MSWSKGKAHANELKNGEHFFEALLGHEVERVFVRAFKFGDEKEVYSSKVFLSQCVEDRSILDEVLCLICLCFLHVVDGSGHMCLQNVDAKASAPIVDALDMAKDGVRDVGDGGHRDGASVHTRWQARA